MHDISSAVLSYLEALSHNELITLLQSFATTHEDIRLAIEEKVAEESTKNKDVAAVEYNRCLSSIAYTCYSEQYRTGKDQFIYIALCRSERCLCPTLV